MAGGKETPRQKMIGMMYLVLTALLALNVSKSILNAFVIMDHSLVQTGENTDVKIASTLQALELSNSENRAKAGPWYDAAKEVDEKSRELLDWISMMKAKTIMYSDGISEESTVIGEGTNGLDTVMNSANISGKDNYDKPTLYLGLAEPNNPVPNPVEPGGPDALQLEEKLAAYREFLLSKVKQSDVDNGHPIVESIKTTFALEGGVENDVEMTWAGIRFYHSPLVACIAAMSKIQVDIRNVESDMLNYLYSKVDAASFKFNKLEPAVIAQSSYLLTGDTFRAKVFLAAFDTTQAPMVTFAPDYADSANHTFGADTLTSEMLSIENGMGIVKVPAPSTGIYNLKGVIKIKGPEGYVSYPVSTSYQVAQPGLTVSATKMNVFYKGVDNPVSVSAPGVPAESLRVTISGGGGSISKSGEGYVVKVKSGSECKVNVSADVDGKSVNMGSVPFRVKSVPDPKPYFAGKTIGDDKVKKTELTAAQGCIAKMENFDFDLKFNIVSYKVTMVVGGTPIEKPVNGARVSSDVKTMFKKAKPGTRVFIEAIKAKGPDGTVRKLGGLSFKVI